MTNAKTTRRALFSSVIALVLCFTMLMGTTFAWFTDSVSSVGNKIQSGTLKVDVLHGDVSLKDNADHKVFDYDKWEPGYTLAETLTVVNEGTLALKFKLTVFSAGNEVLGANGENLADVIDVYLLDAPTATRPDLTNVPTVGTLADLMADEDGAAYGVLNAEEDTSVTIALKMREEAGNEYQGLSLGDLYISLVATQATVEEDSFDNTYDADASLDDVKSEKIITFTDNVDDAMEIDVIESAKIDMAGNSLNNILINNGELDISDGTINANEAGLENHGDATLNNVTMNAGSAATYSNISYAGSETTYNNVEIVSAGGGIGAAGGAHVVFNSGSVEVNTSSTSGRYLFYAEGEGTVITINGGEFADFTKTSQNQKRAYVYAGAGTTVYINGGTFGKASTRDGYTAGILGKGTVVITGGTFGFDPSTWVADGYVATETNGVWTVTADN